MVWQIYCGTSIFQQNARTVYKVKNTVFTWMKGVIILFLQDWGGWHFLRWFTSSTPGDISFSDLPAAPLVTFPSQISLHHPWYHFLQWFTCSTSGNISFIDLPAAPLGLLSWHYRQCAYLNHFQMYSFLTLPTQMTAQTHTDHKVGSCCKETDKTAKLVQ